MLTQYRRMLAPVLFPTQVHMNYATNYWSAMLDPFWIELVKIGSAENDTLLEPFIQLNSFHSSELGVNGNGMTFDR